MRTISLLLLVLFTTVAFSQPPNGSKSLIHTQTARTFDSGRLEVHSNMNFFTRATDFLGDNTPQDFKAVNYWLVAGNLAFTYGIMDNLDLTIASRLYQDTHYENEYNLPGDVFASLKVGSFSFANRHMYGALLSTFRFATGEEHNYPFAEYASGAVEYAFTGALSYYLDPYLPERSFNAHLNVGWWNHNEASQVVYTQTNGTELKASQNSTELQYAVAFSYPTAMFNYNFELFGTAFLAQPDEYIYSRENYMYVTPSIRYKAFSWLSMDLGIDIAIINPDDETSGVPAKTNPDLNLPNYAAWRAYMGLNLTLLPFTSNARSETEVERDEFNKRVEFFQKIVEERERSEDIQEELDRLKEERQEAENELEELKQIMEEQD